MADLTVKIEGKASIDDVLLASKLRKFFRDEGFGRITVRGLTKERRFGCDGFLEDESVLVDVSGYMPEKGKQ